MNNLSSNKTRSNSKLPNIKSNLKEINPEDCNYPLTNYVNSVSTMPSITRSESFISNKINLKKNESSDKFKINQKVFLIF